MTTADLAFIAQRLVVMAAVVRNPTLRPHFVKQLRAHVSDEDLAWWVGHHDDLLARAGASLNRAERAAFADFKATVTPNDGCTTDLR